MILNKENAKLIFDGSREFFYKILGLRCLSSLRKEHLRHIFIRMHIALVADAFFGYGQSAYATPIPARQSVIMLMTQKRRGGHGLHFEPPKRLWPSSIWSKITFPLNQNLLSLFKTNKNYHVHEKEWLTIYLFQEKSRNNGWKHLQSPVEALLLSLQLSTLQVVE